MNMIVRNITFLVLCGFCTTQTSDVKPEMAPVIEVDSVYCNGEHLAKNEVAHSVIIANEFDVDSSMFAKLKDFKFTVSASRILAALQDLTSMLPSFTDITVPPWTDSLASAMIESFYNRRSRFPAEPSAMVDAVNNLTSSLRALKDPSKFSDTETASSMIAASEDLISTVSNSVSILLPVLEDPDTYMTAVSRLPTMIEKLRRIKTRLVALNNVISEFPAADTPLKLIDRVSLEYLNTVKNYQATWEDSLKHIAHVNQLINIDNSIPYCRGLIILSNGMRKQNYSMERGVFWVLDSYATIYDCVITDDLNCIIDGKNYVLNDIETIEYAADVITFREMYPQLLTVYNNTRQQFTLFHSMTLWFKTLKLTNTSFEESTTDWLSGAFKRIDAELMNIKYQIRDVEQDLDKISNLIKSVNKKTSDISELMEYLITIRSRIPQMQEISDFLDTRVRNMKELSEPIRLEFPNEFNNRSDAEDQDDDILDGYRIREGDISPAYVMREDVESIFRGTRTLSFDAATKSLSDIRKYNNDDMAIRSLFKSFDTMLHKFSVDLASSLQCFIVTLEPMRYVASIKIMRYQKKLFDEDLGAIFGFVQPNYETFLNAATALFTKLIENLEALRDYFDPSTDADNSFFTGELPSDDDMTTFTSFLNQLKEKFTEFFDIQCKTHQSAFYSELVLTFDDESDGAFIDTFEDALVEEVLEREGVSLQEFMTSMNDYYTLNEIKSFYNRFNELIGIYEDAHGAFQTYDFDVARATKMSGIVGRLTRQKAGLSDMTTNGNRFYEVATKTGLDTMRIISDYFQSPNINEDEYGDFRESTESLLITDNINPKPDTQVGKVLPHVMDTPVKDKTFEEEEVAVGNSQFEAHNSDPYDLGDTVHKFKSCPEHCTYILRFELKKNTTMAIECHIDGAGVAFSETRDFVSGDNFSFLIAESGPLGTVDIVYLDKYNKIYSSHHAFNEPCRIYFAAAGKLTYTSKTVTAAIVDIPIDVQESVRYNVYNARAAEGFEKQIYVRKGIYVEDFNPLWTSLTLKSEDKGNGACIGFGITRETVNEFGKVEITGILYDGNKVVSNADDLCRDREVKSYYWNTLVDDDEVLYMKYNQVNTYFGIVIDVTIMSNKTEKSFGFSGIQEFHFSPSYVILKRAGQDIDVAEPRPLENVPSISYDSNSVCDEDEFHCAQLQNCHYEDDCVESDDSCRSGKHHIFGHCRYDWDNDESNKGQ